MVSKEIEIEDSIIKYFNQDGFRCLPDREKETKWKSKKFNLYDEETSKDWIVDVVGFKWNSDGYDLDVRAVEVKIQNVESAIEQSKIYRRHFPWCYIGTTKSSRDYSYLKPAFQLGYLPVENGTVLKSGIIPIESSEYLNVRLDQDYFMHTRQKLVVLDTFIEIFDENNTDDFGFDGNRVWVSSKPPVQYQMNTFNANDEVLFGINIERKENVVRTLTNMKKLQTAISQLKGYEISFESKRFKPSLPRQNMNMLILRKSCMDFSADDADILEELMKRIDYQAHLQILTKVWSHNEFLSRKEHQERVKREIPKLEVLRKNMGWVD